VSKVTELLNNFMRKKWNLFNWYSNSEVGYAISLALSIIRFHGGKVEIDNSKKNNILRIYLSTSFGRRFIE
jgi:hypothetical protein